MLIFENNYIYLFASLNVKPSNVKDHWVSVDNQACFLYAFHLLKVFIHFTLCILFFLFGNVDPFILYIMICQCWSLITKMLGKGRWLWFSQTNNILPFVICFYLPFLSFPNSTVQVIKILLVSVHFFPWEIREPNRALGRGFLEWTCRSTPATNLTCSMWLHSCVLLPLSISLSRLYNLRFAFIFK